MSYTRVIEGIFGLEGSESNLIDVFAVGESSGFSYHIFEDDGWRGIPKEMSITTGQAAFKVMSYVTERKEQEYGPIVRAVYTRENQRGNDQQSFLMGVRQLEPGRIKIAWDGMDPTRIRFADGEEGVDFPYFINKFIDLYGQFNMISLEATYF